MPERDSDRIIYEKLKNYKADYSSADWEQMETMFPRKSRTPYYAVAALLLLLLGSVGLWLGTGGFNREQQDNTITQQEASDNTGSVTGNDQVIAETADIDATQNVEKSTSQNAASAESSATVSEIRAHDKVFGKNDKPEETSVQEERKLTIHTYGKGGVETTVAENNQIIAEDNIASSTVTDNRSVSNSNKASENADHAVNSNGAGAEQLTVVDPIASASEQSSLTEMFTVSNTTAAETAESSMEESTPVFALNRIESGLIQADEKTGKMLTAKDALDGDALPGKKPKKQIVSFAMGGGAGMNFSFTDPALLTTPGYTVDMIEELMFIKRIGIALTQGYSKRVYDGGTYPGPAYSWVDYPNSYSLTISSVDFGVDIKANLVNKTKWSWYVKAGVINTVKLKELFTYNYPEIDTIVPPPQLTPQTNFSGNNDSMRDSLTIGLSADPELTPDLTVSGTKRYHMAYHAATGFDVSINPRVKIQVEAGHSFTQPTVGTEDNRLHSFGINGRVLYCF